MRLSVSWPHDKHKNKSRFGHQLNLSGMWYYSLLLKTCIWCTLYSIGQHLFLPPQVLSRPQHGTGRKPLGGRCIWLGSERVRATSFLRSSLTTRQASRFADRGSVFRRVAVGMGYSVVHHAGNSQQANRIRSRKSAGEYNLKARRPHKAVPTALACIQQRWSLQRSVVSA